MTSCECCKEWGRTITYLENSLAIPCPKCERLTWPNLGVNCPAGCAVAFSSTGPLLIRRRIDEYNDRFDSIRTSEDVARFGR